MGLAVQQWQDLPLRVPTSSAQSDARGRFVQDRPDKPPIALLSHESKYEAEHRYSQHVSRASRHVITCMCTREVSGRAKDARPSVRLSDPEQYRCKWGGGRKISVLCHSFVGLRHQHAKRPAAAISAVFGLPKPCPSVTYSTPHQASSRSWQGLRPRCSLLAEH